MCNILWFYAIFNIVTRIINEELSVPAVVTAAVPTTGEMANTSIVKTYSIERPCIHVVAVVDPTTVFVSILKAAEVGPL